MELSLIAAVSSNGVIGKDGKLPWHIPEDLKLFKELTENHAVIMGRKTYESIGKPLPNRMNIVITTRPIVSTLSNVRFFNSYLEALEYAFTYQKVFVIGGQALYEAFIPLANKLHITHVNGFYEGDIYFPDYNHSFRNSAKWDYIAGELKRYKDIEYKFTVYTRK